jgi:secreted Zn-dependent insulinase-like peptidase
MRNASENILLELIDQILYQPCFDQLRNKEHLGYLVRMSIRKSNGTHGLQIIVQGNSSPSHLQSRIEEFLKSSQQVAFFLQETYLTLPTSTLSLFCFIANCNTGIAGNYGPR